MKDERYYHPDGSLKWGYPVNVEHLILQLQTMDPEMQVSSVMHIGDRARAYGLSMSYERWDADGWLDYQLDVPRCLAIWATERADVKLAETRSGRAILNPSNEEFTP